MTIDNYAAALLGRVKNTQAIAGREARAFGVHRLAGRRYGFYTADGSPLAGSIREQICALRAPETVPEAGFEAYRSFVPSQTVEAPTEPLTAPEGATLSERIKAGVTVLETVSQYVGLELIDLP